MTKHVFFLMLLSALSVNAQVEKFSYNTYRGRIAITGYTGTNGTVTIPSTINGLPVESIEGFAFDSCNSLTNLTIPNSVTYIDHFAFGGCSGLTNLTLGNGLTNIGCSVFHSCPRLASITIANGATSFGLGMFIGCTSLSSITIPDSVSYIGTGAFAGCTSLTNITIPSSVTSIGSVAFSGCTNLTALYFKGNAPAHGAPTDGRGVFDKADKATIYCLPNTTGWTTNFAGRPTAVWKP